MKNPKYEKLKYAARQIGYKLRIRKSTKKSLPGGYIYNLERNGIRFCVNWISEETFEELVKEPVEFIAEVL